MPAYADPKTKAEALALRGRGVSYREVGRKLSVSPASVQNWEREAKASERLAAAEEAAAVASMSPPKPNPPKPPAAPTPEGLRDPLPPGPLPSAVELIERQIRDLDTRMRALDPDSPKFASFAGQFRENVKLLQLLQPPAPLTDEERESEAKQAADRVVGKIEEYVAEAERRLGVT